MCVTITRLVAPSQRNAYVLYSLFINDQHKGFKVVQSVTNGFELQPRDVRIEFEYLISIHFGVNIWAMQFGSFVSSWIDFKCILEKFVAFELWKIFILGPINVLTMSSVDSIREYFWESALTFEYKVRLKILIGRYLKGVLKDKYAKSSQFRINVNCHCFNDHVFNTNPCFIFFSWRKMTLKWTDIVESSLQKNNIRDFFLFEQIEFSTLIPSICHMSTN